MEKDCFWYKVCPQCHGQGRLIIKKRIDNNELFFCCDECMRCWKDNDDLEKKLNIFMQYSIESKIANATEEEIYRFGWNKYKIHRCSDIFTNKE